MDFVQNLCFTCNLMSRQDDSTFSAICVMVDHTDNISLVIYLLFLFFFLVLVALCFACSFLSFFSVHRAFDGIVS